jgi:hypothetical protein
MSLKLQFCHQLHLAQRPKAKISITSRCCTLLSLRADPSLVSEVGLLVLVWVVLPCALALNVVIIVHSLRTLVGVLLGFVGVVLVHSLGLGAARCVSFLSC